MIVNFPKNCAECNFLNDDYDYPTCIVTEETRGYTFQTHLNRMDCCPIKEFPKEDDKNYFPDEFLNGMATGWNMCLKKIKGEEMNF